jgi:ketosteroid isomerase-like protein
MSDETMNAELRELLDREAIRNLARAYADCIWRIDTAGAVELFTEDGVMNTGDRPPIVGRKALTETYMSMVEGAGLQPFVHNHVIELNGDAATGRCYLDLRMIRDGESLIGSGYYVDEYQRTADGWKFRSRTLEMKFLVPIQQGWVEEKS